MGEIQPTFVVPNRPIMLRLIDGSVPVRTGHLVVQNSQPRRLELSRAVGELVRTLTFGTLAAGIVEQ
jgi:hypothetical protein